MTPWMTQAKTIAGLCLIFLLGGLAGGLLDRVIVAHRVREVLNGGQDVTQLLQRRLTRDLHLDADQQAKEKAIISSAALQIRQVRRQVQPQVREILLETRRKTRALLRPDQLAQFEKNLEAAHRRFPRLSNYQLDVGPEAAPSGEPASATNAAPPGP